MDTGAFKSVTELKSSFQHIFGQQAKYTFFCPGRLNLLGDYTDHNGGAILSCALSAGVWMLIAPNRHRKLRLRSVNFDSAADVGITEERRKQGNNWFNYPLGIFYLLSEQGVALKCGYDILYYGNLPVSSGLASSTSLEMVTAFGFNQLRHTGYNKPQLISLIKNMETDFIGIQRGIIDHFAVAFGEENHALLLNGATLSWNTLDLDLRHCQLAIINTNQPVVPDENKYSERMMECQQALRVLRWILHIKELCDITPAILNASAHLFSDQVLWKRARYIVEENERVRKAAIYLKQKNLIQFGRLLRESHFSLSNLFEVSSLALDTIVNFSSRYPGVLGARMTGTGSGQCVFALVESAQYDGFKTSLISHYNEVMGCEPLVDKYVIGGGVMQVE